MGTICASGGVYITSDADKIYAHPETLTGSIGVIMQSMNFSGLMEKYGVKAVTVKSGKNKDMLTLQRTKFWGAWNCSRFHKFILW